MMISKKLQYFYFGYFGLNSIISIIAPIYGISESLIYIAVLVLTLSLIGLYFYIYFKKENYFAPFTQFFIFYGFFNLIILWDLKRNWPVWLIRTIGIINFIGIIIYYYVNNRRNKKFR